MVDPSKAKLGATLAEPTTSEGEHKELPVQEAEQHTDSEAKKPAAQRKKEKVVFTDQQTLFVSNLHFHVDEAALKELFTPVRMQPAPRFE